MTRGAVRASRDEHVQALADFAEAIRLEPKNARAFAVRGVSRFALHDDAAALADCNRAVELAPRDGWVYCCRARVYPERRRPTRELADLDRALELNPRNVRAYFERAACHMLDRDPRRAFHDCAAAMAINPDSALALSVRSLCHLYRGRKQRALADLEKAVTLRPNYSYLRLFSAAFYQLRDEPDKGLAECDLALKGGNNWIAHLAYPLRAAFFLLKGEIKSALADCDQALKLDAKSVHIYALRSVAYSRAGDADRSRSDFDAALLLDREKAYLSRAEILELLKLDNEAIADWTELIKMNPKEAGPYQARAVAYLGPLRQPAAMGLGTPHNDTLIINIVHADMPAGKAGVQVGDRIIRVGSLRPTQFKEVSDYVATFRPGAPFELEIERFGERKVFRMILAARPAEFDKGNPAGRSPPVNRVLDAIGDCKRAIELDPDDPATHRLLAEAYDLLDRGDDAIKSATAALRLDPEDPLTHLLRARSHLQRKEDDKAIADANAALRLEAEGGEPYALRGLAFANQKKKESAQADLAVAARLEPKLAVLKEAYEKQLAQEKAFAPPWQIPMPAVKIPDIRTAVEKPVSEPFQGPSGRAVVVFLGSGAAVFVVAMLVGYLFRGAP